MSDLSGARGGLPAMRRALAAICGVALAWAALGGPAAAGGPAEGAATTPTDPAAQVHAQAALLHKTLGYLKHTIESEASGGRGSICSGHSDVPCSWSYKPKDFSTCKVQWVFSESRLENGRLVHDDSTVTLPLTEEFGEMRLRGMLNDQGDTAAWQVAVHLTEDPVGIYEQKSSQTVGDRILGRGPLREDLFESATHIEFGKRKADNQQTAKNVADAFTRAIELCQELLPKPPEPDIAPLAVARRAEAGPAMAEAKLSGEPGLVASLQATLGSLSDVIQAKAHGHSAGVCREGAADCNWNYQPVQFADCTAKWQYTQTSAKGEDATPIQDTVSIPLFEEFVPVRVRGILDSSGDPAAWQVPLVLRNQQTPRMVVIKTRGVPSQRSPGKFVPISQATQEYATAINFRKEDRDAAETAARDFAHAIAICNAFRNRDDPYQLLQHDATR